MGEEADSTMPKDPLTTARLRSQRLDGTLTVAADVAQAACGLQAQDAAAARLAIRARSAGLTEADVDAAWHEEGELVRTWGMRGTLHLVAREDLRWMLPLFGPTFIRRAARRFKQLGLSEADGRRAVDLIVASLAARGPQTREELAATLQAAGIRTEGQAIFYLIRRAALAGAICYGPYREGVETFIPLDVAPVTAPEADLWDTLARRYLRAYGPAAPEDLAAWSGLPLSETRRAWARVAGEFAAVWDGERELRGSQATGTVSLARLLPAYDNLLLGYRSRAWLVDEDHARRVHPGGGLIRPSLLVRGRLAGTWRLERRRRNPIVRVAPFAPLAPEVMDVLTVEAADVGRFSGKEAVLTMEG